MRSRLVIASQNPDKLREFREALADLPLELLAAGELGVKRFPEETGSSYEENAFVKAAFVATKTGLPSLADDSGLEVEALDGAPGIYSARFGGELSPGERIAYLLQRLRKAPAEAREARFVCSLVLATPEGELRSFHGSCEGRILEGPRGAAGFGYDPIFFSHDLEKTFAEASEAEKRRVSHRGRALDKFAAWLATPGAHLLLQAKDQA